jgi:signal transduction histidine kinase
VVRHAHATRMDIILEKDNEKVVLLVEDDGMGIEPGSDKEATHLGLAGMRERAEMIGASLTVESEPGRGTTVQLVFTLQDRNGSDKKAGRPAGDHTK